MREQFIEDVRRRVFEEDPAVLLEEDEDYRFYHSHLKPHLLEQNRLVCGTCIYAAYLPSDHRGFLDADLFSDLIIEGWDTERARQRLEGIPKYVSLPDLGDVAELEVRAAELERLWEPGATLEGTMTVLIELPAVGTSVATSVIRMLYGTDLLRLPSDRSQWVPVGTRTYAQYRKFTGDGGRKMHFGTSRYRKVMDYVVELHRDLDIPRWGLLETGYTFDRWSPE